MCPHVKHSCGCVYTRVACPGPHTCEHMQVVGLSRPYRSYHNFPSPHPLGHPTPHPPRAFSHPTATPPLGPPLERTPPIIIPYPWPTSREDSPLPTKPPLAEPSATPPQVFLKGSPGEAAGRHLLQQGVQDASPALGGASGQQDDLRGG